ncbi:MAG: L,D-transpeptidase family protein [Acidobacteria bacterium]|nr:L,D-transpeptidase family protein [Acidobacteriota bacterium]
MRVGFEPYFGGYWTGRSRLLWLAVVGLFLLTAVSAFWWYSSKLTGKPPSRYPAELVGMDMSQLQRHVRRLEARVQKLRERQDRLFPRTASILVDTAENRIYLYQGSRLVEQGRCSTGTGLELTDTQGNRTWTFDTPRGYFRVVSKVTDPVWYRPDWAFIEEGEPIPKNPESRAVADVLGDYALGFGDGYFIHGTLYTRLLGSSVTHGCIRVDDDVLKRIYDAARPGTPIWIY